jgi:hypothetical protein
MKSFQRGFTTLVLQLDLDRIPHRNHHHSRNLQGLLFSSFNGLCSFVARQAILLVSLLLERNFFLSLGSDILDWGIDLLGNPHSD